MKTYTIKIRKKQLINTDPQRRCYNGCHFSSELRWTEWETLDSNIPENKLEDTLKFWRELNDYAVSERGKGAQKEFQAVEET
jgi:hypothetical protein